MNGLWAAESAARCTRRRKFRPDWKPLQQTLLSSTARGAARSFVTTRSTHCRRPDIRVRKRILPLVRDILGLRQERRQTWTTREPRIQAPAAHHQQHSDRDTGQLPPRMCRSAIDRVTVGTSTCPDGYCRADQLIGTHDLTCLTLGADFLRHELEGVSRSAGLSARQRLSAIAATPQPQFGNICRLLHVDSKERERIAQLVLTRLYDLDNVPAS